MTCKEALQNDQMLTWAAKAARGSIESHQPESCQLTEQHFFTLALHNRADLVD